eukprot:m.44690 g.44690  ORF g.44690 m.44690 type:complete len:243 (-) comp47051_c1_seq2:254-982(-)
MLSSLRIRICGEFWSPDFMRSHCLRHRHTQERLMKLELYHSGPFVDGKLRFAANPFHVDRLTRWSELHSTKDSECTVVMYGVNGEATESRENSGSFRNVEEVQQIALIIKKLLQDPSLRLTHQDISVMCAYRHQVLFMRKCLREQYLSEIRVGTVDDYQGQEALVTIVSTVSSAWDTEKSTGHLGNGVAHRRRKSPGSLQGPKLATFAEVLQGAAHLQRIRFRVAGGSDASERHLPKAGTSP